MTASATSDGSMMAPASLAACRRSAGQSASSADATGPGETCATRTPLVLTWRRVVWVHGLRNASLPIVTVVGLYVGILLGNSVLTEIVFSRPGLGKLILTALSQRDYTLLQGMIVVYTLMVVVVNLLTDLTYGFLDPRVQYK